MLKLPIAVLLVWMFLKSSGTAVNAESLVGSMALSGEYESELSMTTGTVNRQKFEFLLTPEINAKLSPAMHLTVISRLRGDIENELEPGKPGQGNRSAYSKRWLAGGNLDVELREAYIDTEIGGSFLRLGKQQVVWGQADGLKILDILNPQSFREFILDDFEDSRIPLWTVNVEIPVNKVFLQILWIPDQTYDDIPESDAIFAFTSPQLVPVLPIGVPVHVLPVNRPNRVIRDSDVGVKLSMFVNGWDYSLNYAYHYFDRPVVRREISITGITVLQEYKRTHLLGGTFSNVFDDFTLRGEFGFSSDRFFLTSDTNDRDGVIESGEFSYVLGLDYQGWRDWFVSGQVFQSFITKPTASLVRDKAETTITLLLRRDFMNEVLQAEVLAIQSLNLGDGVIQISIEYEWRSNIRLKVGADVFYGDLQGLFGQFDKQDRISLGIEFGF